MCPHEWVYAKHNKNIRFCLKCGTCEVFNNRLWYDIKDAESILSKIFKRIFK